MYTLDSTLASSIENSVYRAAELQFSIERLSPVFRHLVKTTARFVFVVLQGYGKTNPFV